MLKVGLTGGIASGKSTVARLFAAEGVPVIDADAIAREVVAPESEGLARIREHFGDDVIDANGALDRAALRAIIFADSDKKALLESLLHPLIRARSDELEQRARRDGAAYAIFEIPLLLESGRQRDMDCVLVVDVAEATQVARVTRRDNCSAEQAHQILAAQSPRAARLAIADDVIENDGEERELAAAVKRLHHQYLDRAANG